MPSSSGRCFQVRDGARARFLCVSDWFPRKRSLKNQKRSSRTRICRRRRVARRDGAVSLLITQLGEAIFLRHLKRKFHVSRLHTDHGEVEQTFVGESNVAADPVPVRVSGRQRRIGDGNCRAPRTVSSLIKVKRSRSDGSETRMIKVVSPSGRQ